MVVMMYDVFECIITQLPYTKFLHFQLEIILYFQQVVHLLDYSKFQNSSHNIITTARLPSKFLDWNNILLGIRKEIKPLEILYLHHNILQQYESLDASSKQCLHVARMNLTQ